MKPPYTRPYSVEPSDTLMGIAIKFDMTVQELTTANRIWNKQIFPGQKLFVKDIPGPSQVLPAAEEPASTGDERVKDEILEALKSSPPQLSPPPSKEQRDQISFDPLVQPTSTIPVQDPPPPQVSVGFQPTSEPTPKSSPPTTALPLGKAASSSGIASSLLEGLSNTFSTSANTLTQATNKFTSTLTSALTGPLDFFSDSNENDRGTENALDTSKKPRMTLDQPHASPPMADVNHEFITGTSHPGEVSMSPPLIPLQSPSASLDDMDHDYFAAIPEGTYSEDVPLFQERSWLKLPTTTIQGTLFVYHQYIYFEPRPDDPWVVSHDASRSHIKIQLKDILEAKHLIDLEDEGEGSSLPASITTSKVPVSCLRIKLLREGILFESSKTVDLFMSNEKILPIMGFIADFEPETAVTKSKKISIKSMGSKLSRTFSSPIMKTRKASQPNLNVGDLSDPDDTPPKFVEDTFDAPSSKPRSSGSDQVMHHGDEEEEETEDPHLPHLHQPSLFLTPDHIEMLSEHLPKRAGLSDWSLVYSTFLHGMTLSTLFHKMAQYQGPSLVVMQDTDGYIFGAFASEQIHHSHHYYGNGECFLFRLEPRRSIFPWSRMNDYFIFSSLDSLAFGGGSQGAFGLWVDSDFNRGNSQRCETYGNPTLSKNADFICKGVEVWGFSDFMPSS